jgi:hypothetical protein
MKDFPIDLGTLIAYFVPGYVAIRGFAYISHEFDLALRSASAEGLVFLFVLSIGLGMIISICRSGTIDKTFQWNLKELLLQTPLLRRLAPCLSKTYADTSGRVEPKFDRLASDSALAAFLAAKAEDMRPYQFYGNTLLALALYFGCRFIGARYYGYGLWGTFGLALLATPAGVGLYTGARASYIRFMRSVDALNERSPGPPDLL